MAYDARWRTKASKTAEFSPKEDLGTHLMEVSMRVGFALVLATLAVSACSSSSDPSSREDVADSVGTPFYIAFKIPVCVATVAIAAPLAGLAGLSDPPEYAAGNDPRPTLDYGIRRNCGPPYVLTPGNSGTP